MLNERNDQRNIFTFYCTKFTTQICQTWKIQKKKKTEICIPNVCSNKCLFVNIEYLWISRRKSKIVFFLFFNCNRFDVSRTHFEIWIDNFRNLSPRFSSLFFSFSHNSRFQITCLDFFIYFLLFLINLLCLLSAEWVRYRMIQFTQRPIRYDAIISYLNMTKIACALFNESVFGYTKRTTIRLCVGCVGVPMTMTTMRCTTVGTLSWINTV